MSSRFILPAVFSGLIVAASLPVGASEADEVIEVPEIDVSGAPVISESVSRESSPTTVIEDPPEADTPTGTASLLGREPAMLVRDNGGAGQSVSVSVRGSDPRSTLVSLDGVPLNSPFLGGADLNSLGLLTLDSISVVRGGQGALRGTDSAGGLVSAASPRVIDGGGFTRAGLSAGSWGTARLKVAHGHFFNNLRRPLGLFVSAGFMHSGGQFDFVDSNGTGRTRDHNASLSFQAMAKVESEPAESHRVNAMVEFFRADRDIAGLEQFPSDTATQVDTRALARLSWTGPKLYGKRGVTTASAWFRFLDFCYDDPSPQMGPAVRTDLASNSMGVSFSSLAAPVDRFAIRLGVDGGYQSGVVRRAGRTTEYPDRGNIAATAGIVAGGPEDPWQLSADVRLEYNSGTGFIAVPGLGVWYEPHKMVRLFANVGRSYRLPTLEELHFDSGYVQGNPDLNPEDSLTWDSGIEVGRGRWWTVKAAYFENYGFNLIMFSPISAFVMRAVNSGGAVLRGVESSARIEWKWLEIKAAYTYLFSRLDNTGHTMPARPSHVVRGTVGFRGGPFRLALMPSWQSAFYLDNYESLFEEGRFRLDLRLEVRPKPYLVMAVDFLNVTNKKDAVDFIQQPLPGFSAFGSIRIEL